MRLSTLVVGVLCGFPLNEAATIWPRFRPAIETDYHLDKRVVIEPPKIPPKVITPGTSPKEGPAPGQSCARSWLWRRACTPPSNPGAEPGSSPGNPSAEPGSPPDNPSAEPGSSPGVPSSNQAGSPGSIGGDSDVSDTSLLSDLSERMKRVNPEPGIDQILPPSEYVDRGKLLLQANHDAATANPRVGKVYDNWSVRYNRPAALFDQNGVIPKDVITANDKDTISVLEHHDIGLDAHKEWTYVGYYSKGEEAAARAARRGAQSVATAFVDKEGGALVCTDGNSQVDTDLDQAGTPEPDRLPNSELLYQSWVDEIGRVTPSIAPRAISDLKFVAKFPIVNAGTRITIKDAYTAKALDLTTKATFLPSDSSYMGILGDCWSGITGTVNGRPAALMGTDHPDTLNGLEIVKIHAWYQIPSSTSNSALVFELGRVS